MLHQGKAYLLGAFGDLHCVEFLSGKVVWKTNILERFDAAVPTWGCCATPLVVGSSLIVNPGGSKASLAALDLTTGEVVWTLPPENAAGYGSFISLEVDGNPQIVGCDENGLGGWDPRTGKRLWRIVDEGQAYRAASPVALGVRLLLGDETNGTAVYRFLDEGRPQLGRMARVLAQDYSLGLVRTFSRSGGSIS